MGRILISYNSAKVGRVWHLTDTVSWLLACQGSYGQTKEGFHCHWNNVDGDFHSIDEVLAAHGLQPNEYF